MGGGGQQVMGQVGQAVQSGMSQGSPTVPSAPAPLPAQLPGNYAPTAPAQDSPVGIGPSAPIETYQDDRARFPMQPQQPSWQQNPEWQGYQSQMQELQNKMQAYQRQYQPQQQNQQYQPRSRDGWGYGGRGGSNWGQQQGPFQSGGLAGLLGAFSGNRMFKNGGRVE